MFIFARGLDTTGMNNLSIGKHRYQLSSPPFLFLVKRVRGAWKVGPVVPVSRYLERRVARDIDL